MDNAVKLDPQLLQLRELLIEECKNAKAASRQLLSKTSVEKNQVLVRMAEV